MPRHPKSSEPGLPARNSSGTVNFRRQVLRGSPIGQVYICMSESKAGRKLMEDSLINCLLPYAYQALEPQRAKEAAKVSIKNLREWIQAIQRDFKLEVDTVPEETKGTNSLSPKQGLAEVKDLNSLPLSQIPFSRVVEVLKPLCEAMNSQSVIAEELRLLREKMGTTSLGTSPSTVPPSMEKPKADSTGEAVDNFLSTSTDFLSNLEEIL